MSSPGASTTADASTLGGHRDASTLTVTAFNVGMLERDSFKGQQKVKVKKLALIVLEWLTEPGGAVVGLNEIHLEIAEKLRNELRQKAPAMDVQTISSQSNTLLWCAPQ